MSDVYMRIALGVTGSSVVLGAISSIGKALGAGGLGSAFSNLAFGMRNLQTDGTIGMDALKLGAVGLGNELWKLVGVTALLGGAAAIAIGVKATQAAGQYNSSLTSLVTGAGEAQANMSLVSNGILTTAAATGTATAQLVSGMYQIESAGYHGSAGLQVLNNAAMGAKVGNADLATVSDATTTILKDFGLKASQSSIAVNTLIATVANGKTTMDQLAGSLSQILPTAAAARISLTDTSAALATMTGEGIPAANAATYLRQTILTLDAPSKGTVKALADIGLSASQTATAMQTSLPGALQMITDALAKKFPPGSAAYVDALKNIAGGSKQMQGILALTGTHLAEFKTNVTNVTSAVKQGGSSVTGWSLVQQNFNQKMAQAKEVVETLFIRLGQQLLPTLTHLASALLPVLSSFADWLVKSGILTTALNLVVGAISAVVGWISTSVTFFQKNQWALDLLIAGLITLAGIITGLLISAFIAWAAAMLPVVIEALTLAAPFILIGIIVTAVIFGIIMVIQHWGQIVAWLKGVWAAFSSWVGGIFSAIGSFFQKFWAGIISDLQSAWNWIVGIAQAGLKLLLVIFLAPFKAIGDLFVWLYNHNYYIKAAVDAIIGFFKGLFSWATGAWNGFTGWLGGLWNGLKSVASRTWGAVSSTVGDWTSSAVSGTKSAWGTASNWLGDRWGQLKGAASTAWSAVSKVFGGIWQNYIAGPLGNLWNQISTWFGNLAKQALQWGANLITSFINGIKNMFGSIGNTLSSVGHNIASFLGFHSPTKEGPGRDADKWAPNLMKMYAQGLQANIPQLQSSLALVMRPVSATLSGQTPLPRSIGASTPTTSIGSTGHTFNISISTMARSQSEVSRLVDMLEQEMGRRMRSQTPNYSTGVF